MTGKFGESRPGHMHKGVDFAAPRGTAIQAIMDGKVIKNTYEANGAGYHVDIQNADGSISKYFHMNGKSPLKVGSRIRAGQVIGQVGSTGHSTGPHLHLELWKNGKAVDPYPIIKSMNSGIAGKSFAGRYPSMNGTNIRGYALKQAPSSVRGYINEAANTYKIRPELIAAVMKAESGFRPNARSGKGAYGLMQLMPHFGSDRLNPRTNVLRGTNYIATQLKKFGDIRLALSAYNTGPGRVGGLAKKYGNNWNKIMPHLPRETQNYVKRILSYL